MANFKRKCLTILSINYTFLKLETQNQNDSSKNIENKNFETKNFRLRIK